MVKLGIIFVNLVLVFRSLKASSSFSEQKDINNGIKIKKISIALSAGS